MEEVGDNKVFYNSYNAKHFSQMDMKERWYLLRKKDNLIGYDTIFSEHALARMSERRITIRDIIECVKMGQIIEYRKSKKDERITVRATRIKKRQFIVFVSFSIKDNVIVTTYYDDAKNIYKKRNFSKYNEDLKVNKHIS